MSDDDWGTPATKPAPRASRPKNDDDWGSSSKAKSSNDDDWGAPSSSKGKSSNDDWGSSKKGNDDWGTSNSNNNDSWGGGASTSRGGGGDRQNNSRPGDWKCACGMNNFASRTDCRKCSEPKPEGAGGGERSSNSRPGDWKCACGMGNFASRTDCRKCSEPKPEGAGETGGFGGGERSSNGRPGDWKCACGMNNFASRTDCRKCNEPKPEGASGGDSGGDRSSNKKPGDWNCPDCGNNNFASRNECRKCNAEKPEGAGGTDGQKEKPREIYIPPEPTLTEDEMFGNHIESGINFNQFDKIPVESKGENVPKPIDDFKQSGLRSFLQTNVERSGYTRPTPIQKHAIPIILGSRDIMACAQTGSGKTAAFLLPILEILMQGKKELSVGKPQCVIISPTRELAIQIYNEALKFAHSSYLKVCLIYGGTSTRHQSEKVAMGCHILVATPGRLMDFVDKTFITFSDVRFVVLDEADRMLDLGFMPVIEKLMQHETMSDRNERQTLMFSATFPDEIQKIASKFLNNYVFLAIGIVGGASSDVEQNFFEVTKFKKRDKLNEILDAYPNVDNERILVFVETKRTADFLASLLSETKIPSTSIHGDRYQRERELALNDFRSGKMKLLIATSVAARGLDIKNVTHVINYDLPKTIEDYVHRIGRTGRVGNTGKASSFYDPNEDSALACDLVKILSQASQPVPEFLGSAGDFGASSTYGARDIRGGQSVKMQEPDEEW